jgi:hypothetical protein
MESNANASIAGGITTEDAIALSGAGVNRCELVSIVALLVNPQLELAKPLRVSH